MCDIHLQALRKFSTVAYGSIYFSVIMVYRFPRRGISLSKEWMMSSEIHWPKPIWIVKRLYADVLVSASCIMVSKWMGLIMRLVVARRIMQDEEHVKSSGKAWWVVLQRLEYIFDELACLPLSCSPEILVNPYSVTCWALPRCNINHFPLDYSLISAYTPTVIKKSNSWRQPGKWLWPNTCTSDHRPVHSKHISSCTRKHMCSLYIYYIHGDLVT